MRRIPILMLCVALRLFAACGTSSKASSYVTLTPIEEARRALDEGDFAAAVDLYEQHLESEPEDYEIFPMLAAAYAGIAGFDIVEAAKANIEAQGSTSLLDTLNAFLPADPTPEQLDAMLHAKLTILALPEENRNRNNTDISYASSAALQLELYQSSYAIMYLNQFTAVTESGALDISRLQEMTVEDVIVILGNLEEIATKSGTGVPAGAGKVISQVDAQPGETRRDKLIQYLKR